jgi:hypothetical protein
MRVPSGLASLVGWGFSPRPRSLPVATARQDRPPQSRAAPAPTSPSRRPRDWPPTRTWRCPRDGSPLWERTSVRDQSLQAPRRSAGSRVPLSRAAPAPTDHRCTRHTRNPCGSGLQSATEVIASRNGPARPSAQVASVARSHKAIEAPSGLASLVGADFSPRPRSSPVAADRQDRAPESRPSAAPTRDLGLGCRSDRRSRMTRHALPPAHDIS